MKISKNIFEQVIKHCKKEAPKEACGILAGKDDFASELYKVANTSINPLNYYLIEPKEQLKVFKEIREKGLNMLCIYHSHYGVKAYPSKKDLELAFYPECDYLIVSIDCPEQEKGRGIEQVADRVVVRSFEIFEQKITEQPIEITEVSAKKHKSCII